MMYSKTKELDRQLLGPHGKTRATPTGTDHWLCYACSKLPFLSKPSSSVKFYSLGDYAEILARPKCRLYRLITRAACQQVGFGLQPSCPLAEIVLCWGEKTDLQGFFKVHGMLLDSSIRFISDNRYVHESERARAINGSNRSKSCL